MTQETIEIIASFPIYKPFRRENFYYKRRVSSYLRSLNPRFRSKYKPILEELNQFIFCSTESDNSKLLDINYRQKIENRLQKSYRQFGRRVLNKIKKLVATDPEYRDSVKAIKDLNRATSVSIKQELANLDKLPESVKQQVKNLFQDSQMILWDLPGNEIDRIIIGQEVINFEDKSKVDNTPGDIGSIADELTLASIAKHHVPIMVKQIDIIYQTIATLEQQLEKFELGLNNFKNEKEQLLVGEVASVFLGKLLGIREPIVLAQQIMARYLKLEVEIAGEAEEMGSDMVKNLYAQLISSDSIHRAVEQSESIMDRLTDNAERIRGIYIKIEEGKPTGTSSSVLQDFAQFVSTIYYDLEEFRFITEVFQDVPSYISMSGELVGETEDEEVTIAHDTIIYAEDIFKTFPLPYTTVYALRGLDIEIKRGEFVAIMGPSGSGKTTLLNILSGIESTDRGIVYVDGLDLRTATERTLTNFRRDTVAFIYQAYNLLPNFKNQENVQLPADLGTKKDIGKFKQRSSQLLNDVGLGEYVKGFPLRLSGGQQQRVTIARALMNKPEILFADEPTGDLDGITGAQIMDIIDQFHKEGVTIVLVTHDKLVAERADRVIYMQDGQIVESSEMML